MGRLQEQLDHKNAWDLDSQLEQAMDALRCPPPDAEVTSLSGGERRRVALCRLLLSQPDLLLLDEPTNHLDAESVQWLEQHLEKYPGTVVAVTHDRYFLDDVAQWILELDRGHAYPYEGNYSTYLETKAARLKVEGAKDAKKRKRLEDELEWVRSSPRARQTKSRARLDRYEEMAAEADKNRKLDFEEIQIPPGPRLGSVVVEVGNLVKGFGDRCLFENLSFSLPRNGIVGVLGPNGVGKTTLFKMIVGEEKPDEGTIRIGETVTISYVDQSRGRIDPKKNVWEAISDGETLIRVGNVEIPSRAYVAAFGFKGSDQQKPARVMSGGERNRMNLALTLKQGGNLLLLDEPTNDLDVETLGEPGERAAGVPRLRGHHQPRPVVPGPGGHAHPGLGGRRELVLVRGQLRVLREEQDRAPRRRGRPPAPRHLPQARPRLAQRLSEPGGRKTGARPANSKGCSNAAKCPPRSGSPQYLMSVKRFSAHRRDGRCSSRGNTEQPTGTSTVAVSRPRDPLVDLPNALPVQPRRGRARAGQPVQHQVVEQVVPAEHGLQRSGMVRPGPELLHDPGGQEGGRVDQPVADRLRPGGVLPE